MDPARQVETLIAPSVEALGFDLVRVRFVAAPRQPVLQIMAERPDGTMSIEDCAELSRAVSAVLDSEDPIPGAYALEVSSPGIDRPLVRPADYDRFAGFEARVETRMPVEGRKRFRGRIAGMADGTVTIAMPEGSATLPFDLIQDAKLVLTDELVAASLRGQAVTRPAEAGGHDEPDEPSGPERPDGE